MGKLADLWHDLTDEEQSAVMTEWPEEDIELLLVELEAELGEDAAKEDPLAHLDTASWMHEVLPDYFPHEFADFHLELCHFIDGVIDGSNTQEELDSFLAVWSRAVGKSTLHEAIVVMLGCRRIRKYALYTSSVQALADTHVQTIAAMCESPMVNHYYPAMSQRLLGKFGNPRAWRRDRLRTANGFTIDAIGLDTAARGVKSEMQRPDVLIFDDLDEITDSDSVTEAKIDTITQSLLPAGAENVLVFGCQNLIKYDGVFGRRLSGKADFLVDAQISGPIPAVRNAVYGNDEKGRSVLISGEATWPAGMDIKRCNQMIRRFGLRAFRRECQHERTQREGALWRQEMIDAGRLRSLADVGALIRIVVAIDPSVGKSRTSDETGIMVVGRNAYGHLFVLEDVSGMMTPERWARVALDTYARWEADMIVGEVNNGGDLVRVNLMAALREGEMAPAFDEVRASRGKDVRAEPVMTMYGSESMNYTDHRIHHVGHFQRLEDEMTMWVPGDAWSPGRIDALVWACWSLGTDGVDPEPDTSADYLEFLASEAAFSHN